MDYITRLQYALSFRVAIRYMCMLSRYRCIKSMIPCRLYRSPTTSNKSIRGKVRALHCHGG